MRSVITIVFALILSGMGFSATLIVPDDHATIQAAIVAAGNGDQVLVRMGTYVENINFLGKDILVQSLDGPAVTVIDGNSTGSTVLFNSGEGNLSVLDGFTITNGTGTLWKNGIDLIGGGICCWDHTEPTIINNWITGNSILAPYVADGGGIATGWFAAPIISGNLIYDNWAAGANGAVGGGVAFGAFSSGVLTNNIIYANRAGVPDPKGRSIRRPSSFFSPGLGCLALNGGGGAVALGEESDPVLTNNTLVANDAAQGGGLFAYLSTGRVYNSIIWNNFAHVDPEISVSTKNLTVTYSDVKGGWPGTGNVAVDPLFINPTAHDFHLTRLSPCIEQGSNQAEALPLIDIDGEPRILFGLVGHPSDRPVSGPSVDIGADEIAEKYTIPPLFPIKKG